MLYHGVNVQNPRSSAIMTPASNINKMGDPKAQEMRRIRLTEIQKGKANLKKLEELARTHWADHSTRMPEPVPHRKMKLKPLKIGIPCQFHETDFDQWEPTIFSQPIQQPPGGYGPLGSSLDEDGRSTVAGTIFGTESRLRLPVALQTGGGAATQNLDPKFYEFTPRELVKPFMMTGPIMRNDPQYRPAKPAEHTHGLTEVHRRPSLINRDINIRKKRPFLTKTNLLSSTAGTIQVMKQTLPELVETEPEKAVLPEVNEFDPLTLKKETTLLLLDRIDKMLCATKQKVKNLDMNSEESVQAETPNMLELRSFFSDDEDLPDVIPRKRLVVGTDAAADMLKVQGEVTGNFRPSEINVKIKCKEWLRRYTIQ